jgi:hypothetical protein
MPHLILPFGSVSLLENKLSMVENALGFWQSPNRFGYWFHLLF